MLHVPVSGSFLQKRQAPRLPVGLSAVRILSLVAVVLLVGCGDSGPPRAKVTGKVTYKDQPLETGTITFVPQDPGHPYGYAEIRANGTYTAHTPDFGSGVAIGSYKVMISAVKDTGPESPVVPLIPDHYSSDQMSGLTAEVSQGENVIDFSLQDNPPAKRR